ncbi:MAG: hypothetical protein FWE07_09295 [Turicibacter sp.]|nr:hypothetical protein [Turicibacter sp.]
MIKLTNEFNHYLEILTELYQELESLPAGSLVKARGSTFYHKINGKRIGITNDRKKISELARKKFIFVFTRNILYNMSLIKKGLTSSLESTQTLDVKKLKPLHPRDIINSLPESYQGLSESSFYHSSTGKWLAETSAQNEYKKELQTFKSKSGQLFRSRGEQSFANLLEDNGLPYKSDVALTLGGVTKYPDFIVINPFTGKQFVLEFFGLADQSGYDKKMNNKMDWYRMNNVEVIYLFESDMRDSQHLQNLIDEKIWGI